MTARLAAVSLLAAALWIACSDNVTAPDTEYPLYYLKAPTNSGDGQSDTVLATLPLPFRVLVRRADAPAPGIKVVWEIDGDTLTGTPTVRDTSLTDASGIATSPFRLTLGRTAGLYAVRARVPGLFAPAPIQIFTDVPCGSALCFNATARPGRATQLHYVSGNDQVDTLATTLEADYILRAMDSYGNSAAGVVIDWTVTAGGGSIAPARDTTTLPWGIARARHTLGPMDSAQRVSAMAVGMPGVQPIIFTASGFPLLPVASVTIMPESASVAADRTVRLSAVLRDANGRTLIWRHITWTSDDPAIATVDTSGLVRGMSPGTTIVFAESEGIRDTALIVVTPGPPPVVFASLGAGSYHTCGLRSDGAAYCWGANTYGQLGISSTSRSLTPVAVSGGLVFSKLVAGAEHTCGLATDSVAYCWGRGDDGQLGNGVFTNRSLPIAVFGGLKFSTLGTGAYHTCGVTTTGDAYCWGWGDFGQLGNGEFSSWSIPRLVAGNHHFVSIGVGFGWHTCGIVDSGAAYCWGHNADYTVQIGPGDDSPVPVLVSGGLSFTSVTTGAFHSCALNDIAVAYCWGDNHWGELGDGSSSLYRSAPGPVSEGSNMTGVTSGGGHSCMVAGSGAAACWGRNEAGQIGDGSLTERHTPVPVTGGLTFALLTGGGSHTCGLAVSGAAYCWGSNASGQLGDGTATDSPLPVRVVSGP